MYLYLVRSNDISFVFHNVCLMGGHLPFIGDGSGAASESAKSLAADLEPAMWFKVSVLDSITIECSQKVLKWSMQTLEQDIFTESLNSSSLRVMRSLYLENEYDSIDCRLDSLFEAGAQLADSLVANSPDAPKQLLTFLTDHVLPEVKISREDEEVVRAAMQKQGQLIAKLDADINARAVKIDRLKQTLRDFRIPVVDDFLATDGKLKKSRPELYEVICKHLQKDVAEANVDLQMAGKQHEAAAASSHRAQVAESKQRLSEARARSEELRKAHDKLTMPSRGRMSLSKRNVLTSQDFLRDRKPIHDLYMASSLVLETLRKENAELLMHKVAAMSVKEAMRIVLQDLCFVEETVGYETQTGTGRMATDIHQNPAKSAMAFTSIAEKVKAILRDPAHPACRLHETFCASTHTTCRRAVTAHATAAASAASAAVVDEADCAFGRSTGNCATDAGDGRELSLSGESNGSGSSDGFVHADTPKLKNACEELRCSVAQHCASMVRSMLPSDTDRSPTMQQRKHLCYEYYLYECIGRDLLALFYTLHGGETQSFVAALGDLTAADLQLEEPWQVRLLAETRLHNRQLQPQQPLESALNGDESMLAAAHGDEFDSLADAVAGSGHLDDGCRPASARPRIRVHSLRAVHHSCAVSREAAVLPSSSSSACADDDNADKDEAADEVASAAATALAGGLEPLRLAVPRPIGGGGSDSGGGHASSDGNASSSSSSTAPDAAASSPAAAEAVGVRLRRPLRRSGLAGEMRRHASMAAALCVVWQRDIFAPAVECLQKMALQPSPLGKLQLLTRCLRFVAASEGKLRNWQQQSALAAASSGDKRASEDKRAVSEVAAAATRPPSTCSDDLIAATVLLLLCADASLVCDVCVQLKFIEAFMNDGLQSGVHAFSLATFEGAAWHLSDLVLMKRRRPLGSGAGTAYRSAAGCVVAS